jgi:hypothetical protein
MDRETAEDIKRHFDATAGGLRGEIVALRAEIVAVDEKLDGRFEELKRHFEVVGEALRSDIAPSPRDSSRQTTVWTRFQVKVSDRFGEMETMLRLSFGELARRIQ